jgi:antitoxin component YwqK of YwqJK toxin-antitoxin module
MQYEADDLSFDEDQRVVDHNNEPFTGDVVERFTDGTIAATRSYIDGMEHGVSREFFKDGSVKSVGEWTYGRPAGTHHKWHSNGRLAEAIEHNSHGQIEKVSFWNEAGEKTR